jgi:hypothetical protein
MIAAPPARGLAMREKSRGPLSLVPPGAERPDADLVVGFLRGEGWASAALWERYAPMVRRIVKAHNVHGILSTGRLLANAASPQAPGSRLQAEGPRLQVLESAVWEHLA